SMNQRPGMARPDNSIVPFGEFENLHYARFVIVDDTTLNDFTEYGAPIPDFPIMLAFLGDCDGDADDLLADLARRAAPGLRQIFSFCRDFTSQSDLLAWMTEHSQAPAANYVNWIGRTVKQIREEAVLRRELVACVKARQKEFEDGEPQQIRAKLIAHGQALLGDRRIALTRPVATPFTWSVRNFLHYAIVPGALLLPWLVAI